MRGRDHRARPGLALLNRPPAGSRTAWPPVLTTSPPYGPSTDGKVRCTSGPRAGYRCTPVVNRWPRSLHAPSASIPTRSPACPHDRSSTETPTTSRGSTRRYRERTNARTGHLTRGPGEHGQAEQDHDDTLRSTTAPRCRIEPYLDQERRRCGCGVLSHLHRRALSVSRRRGGRVGAVLGRATSKVARRLRPDPSLRRSGLTG
jgi:hypothetical protein